MRTLVCSAMPFGYGPAAKLLTLARDLRGRDESWRLVFVGRGTALELTARERSCFDEVIVAGDVHDAAWRRAMAGASGVLSVMDREAAAAAAHSGKPLFVVDSLLWMRPSVPEALGRARLYFSQRFVGDAAPHGGDRVVEVGPIVPTRETGGGPTARAGLLVHLGGSEAPDGRRELYADYARLVVAAVEAAGLCERFDHVEVLGGAALVDGLRRETRDPRIELASVSHHEARERMARAAAVLSAPGLTATLECFRDATPLWFLPPQNYSQWCILRRLRRWGAADDALHWEDLPDVPHVAERLPARERDPAVIGQIERLARDAEVAAALRDRLTRVGLGTRERLGTQGALFASLGPPAGETIAAALSGAAMEEIREAPEATTRVA